MKTLSKIAILIFLFSFVLSSGHVAAATITVNGSCTLADAITAANTDTATGGCPAGSGADTITLTSDVVLTGALPHITSEITIEGTGHGISGMNAPEITILHVENNGILTLNDATIEYGSGGILPLRGGGGIYSKGTLTVNRSTISRNSSSSGGGIYNDGGTLTINDSTISNNAAEYHSSGGGIYNNGGAVTINNSTISNNTASNNGGGIFIYEGTANINNTTISNNKANNNGGGISEEDATEVIITNSTISDNESSGSGGGIFSISALKFHITNCTISDNSTTGYGGGLEIDSDGENIIESSTITGNTAGSNGAGISISTDAQIINSTISGNSADRYGGGVYIGWRGTMNHSTVSDNSAASGGGVYVDHEYGQITVSNSIIALQSSGNDCGIYYAPNTTAINSQGYNIESATTCNFNQSTDQQNVTAAQLNLQPLADNGGPTKTMALGTGSVALDQIPAPCSVNVDQRGVSRPQNGKCDVGAYEFKAQSPTPTPTPPNEIPEPTTILLIGSGLAGLAGYVRRKRKQA